MSRLHWLDPADPPDRFPPASDALDDPDGLLAIGGDLSSGRLLAAYRQGIFPWYQPDQPILWWSPAHRAVLFPQDLHISRSLRKTLRQDRFDVSMDTAFNDVIDACGSLRADTGTWITPDMITAYCALHLEGHAHSIEAWIGNELAGGLYGVAIGGVFFGESMFSRRDDASKVALAGLVAASAELDIRLIDCQLPSPHLASLGSRQIPRNTFLELLQRHIALDHERRWQRPRRPSSALLKN